MSSLVRWGMVPALVAAVACSFLGQDTSAAPPPEPINYFGNLHAHSNVSDGNPTTARGSELECARVHVGHGCLSPGMWNMGNRNGTEVRPLAGRPAGRDESSSAGTETIERP